MDWVEMGVMVMVVAGTGLLVLVDFGEIYVMVSVLGVDHFRRGLLEMLLFLGCYDRV